MTSSVWTRAMVALELLALDPRLGGVWLRARVGPQRTQFLEAVHATTRITPAMTEEALFGGLDLTRTLAEGSPIYAKGVFGGGPKRVLLSSAERTPAHLAARLAQVLDGDIGHVLIASDEGIDDEHVPSAISDRLAFHICLDDLPIAACETTAEPKDTSFDAAIGEDGIAALIGVAAQLGVAGLRAPLFAVRAAKAAARLAGRDRVAPEDLELAAALVLGPRATQLPMEAPEDQAEDSQPHPPDDAPPPDDAEAQNRSLDVPEEVLLEAALAALPPDVLSNLKGGTGPNRASGHSAQGARKKGNARGRPLPPRRGCPDGRTRIDLMSTLRAAIPWQQIRSNGSPQRLHFRTDDIHLKRFETRSDRLLIFAVDASGSAAMNRLAEAKGAVELLLAEAYANRDHVALVAYNKTGAELLLPPTRSLVQTKRRLAQLPGGGATPLAAGLREAVMTATRATQKGLKPAIILIADGRTNMDLAGNADRVAALEDARTIARSARAMGLAGVVIDMSKRPEAQLRDISVELGANYIALPFADAARLSQTVATELAAS